MAFADGELAADLRARTLSHLLVCASCHEAAERLRVSLATPMLPEPESGDSLDSLLEGITALKDSRFESTSDVSVIKARAADEIAPYLGTAAAQQIMVRVSPNGDDLLSRIESVLALFLGGRAADELTSHIVDTAIVRP